jgi:hypothetical protein
MNRASYSVETRRPASFIVAIRGPLMLITLGTLLAVDHFGPFGFHRTWPVLVILFGVLKLLERMGSRPATPQPPAQPPAPVAGGPLT